MEDGEEGQWNTSPPPLSIRYSSHGEGFIQCSSTTIFKCRNWQTILSNLLLKCKFDELLLLPKYYNKQKLHYKWHEWFNKVTESYCLQDEEILCKNRLLKVDLLKREIFRGIIIIVIPSPLFNTAVRGRKLMNFLHLSPRPIHPAANLFGQ